MKRSMGIILLAAGLLLLLAGCQGKGLTAQAEKELGLDLSGGTVVAQSDTHSGNGDGLSVLVLRWEEETLEKQLAADDRWQTLPGDLLCQTLFWGASDETSQVGPFFQEEGQEIQIPLVTQGYWMVLDRHSQAKEGEDPKEMLGRYSYNCTAALYDTAQRTLYVCRLDTWDFKKKTFKRGEQGLALRLVG